MVGMVHRSHCHIVCTPPNSRVGLGDFSISSLPVGLGFSKNQGGVPIVGWGCFYQRGFGLSSMQKIFVQFISISFLMTKETNKRRPHDGYVQLFYNNRSTQLCIKTRVPVENESKNFQISSHK